MASTFVTLSWNTSGALSTGRGYILQVKRAYPASILAAASAPQASNSKDAGASGRQTTGTSKASQGMFMELRNTKKVYIQHLTISFMSAWCGYHKNIQEIELQSVINYIVN